MIEIKYNTRVFIDLKTKHVKMCTKTNPMSRPNKGLQTAEKEKPADFQWVILEFCGA